MKNIKDFLRLFIILLIVINLFGCFPKIQEVVQEPEEALKQVRFFFPDFHDDMDTNSLNLAVKRNLLYLNRLDPEKIFQYGPHQYTCLQVIESQQTLLTLMKENPDPNQLSKNIRKNFQVYRAAGRSGNNEVLFTGYFEPVYDGSLTPDEVFKYPIYQKPCDLLKINLSRFNRTLRGKSIIARIDIDGKDVVPYYSRFQIEVEKALDNKGLEIAWLKNPLDVAFLQIQGSGRLKLPDGEMLSVGYKASNGRPYRSIGRYMLKKGILTKDEISMQRIRSYLSEHPADTAQVLNHNPSYVFFKIRKNGPFGNINVPLTPGRSLALDAELFPKGALAFIFCQKPVIDNQGVIIGWKKFSRFVLIQDTGGAIKGAGRADLFWGSGTEAEISAGHLQHDGGLYILIKKQ